MRLLQFLSLLSVVGMGFSSCQRLNLSESNMTQVNPQAKVIYGSDDRLDYTEITDSELQSLAHSTVALIENHNMVYDQVFDQYVLKNPDTSLKLCTNEKFRKQPTWAFCSGSLVAPDVILTAGHCIEDKKTCKETNFVFDYTYMNSKKQLNSFPAANVYKCSDIIYSVNEKKGADFALIRLDRAVTDRRVLELSSVDAIMNDDLLMIGHPAGYPTKFTMNVKVRDQANQNFLVVSADSYVGNSGSSVFDVKTHKIIGVLDRGEQDYTLQNSCFASKVCSENECRGEDVTRASVIQKFLK